MRELNKIYSKKKPDNRLLAGSFYFKVDESDPRVKPVLIFATQLKTQRPATVLNSAMQMTLNCLAELRPAKNNNFE